MENIKDFVELIKGSIYCALRQKFEVEEVSSIYKLIDDVADTFERDSK